MTSLSSQRVRRRDNIISGARLLRDQAGQAGRQVGIPFVESSRHEHLGYVRRYPLRSQESGVARCGRGAQLRERITSLI